MPTDNNPNTLLLQETAKLFDLVDIVLCAYLYKVCNNVLFEDMLGTDFVNFLNNRPTTTPVVVKPKQKNRVCHLLHIVSERLVKPALAKPWISSMLSTLLQAPQRDSQEHKQQGQQRLRFRPQSCPPTGGNGIAATYIHRLPTLANIP